MAPALRRSGRRWRSPSRASQASFSQVTITSPNAASTIGLPESRADTLRASMTDPVRAACMVAAVWGNEWFVSAVMQTQDLLMWINVAGGGLQDRSTAGAGPRCMVQVGSAGVRALDQAGAGVHRHIVSWCSMVYLSSTRISRRRWRKLECRHTCF